MLLLTAREVRLWRNPTPAPELAAFGRPTAMPRGSSRRCAPTTLSAKPMTTKSAIMRASQLGANTPAAVEPEMLMIVGQSVTEAANDKQQLEPMVEAIEQQSGQRPEEILADNGYC